MASADAINKDRCSDPKLTTGSDDSDSIEYEKNSNKRHTWSSKREYVLSMVGYAVGLGNIWRFPYICMNNGGGAFLIPYFLNLILLGIPVFFMETSMGQFQGKSSLHVWSICPLFKGIGISMSLLSILSMFYYTMILGWAVIFLVNSFKSPLPWTLCDQPWNTPNCFSPKDALSIPGNESLFLGNASVPLDMSHNSPLMNNTAFGNEADTLLTNLTTITQSARIANTSTSSAEEFWLHNVLEISSGLNDLDGLPWHTAVALVVSNFIVLMGIFKGIRTSGKVVYVSATLPYLLLTVILILGCTLPGAGDGVIFYLKPDFGKLMTLEPWMQAAIQVFYSLGASWGAILTMASYNKFNNDCMTDSIALSLFCEATSIFGGFAIFTVLGHMAYKANVDISTFAKSGAGLAFVVYPEAISYLPLPQLWGFIFFLMLFSLGLDSTFTTVETVITLIADVWPIFFVTKWRVLITSLTMTMITLIGFVFASRGGMYWFQLFDWYIGAFAILLQGFIECIVISWVYGFDRFGRDVELMVGRKPLKFFEWSLKIVTPFLLIVLWFLTLLYYKPPTYEGYIYPAYAEVFGWFIAVTPFSAVLLLAFFELRKHPGTFMERLRSASKATSEWAPSSPEFRDKYHMVPTDVDSKV